MKRIKISLKGIGIGFVVLGVFVYLVPLWIEHRTKLETDRQSPGVKTTETNRQLSNRWESTDDSKEGFNIESSMQANGIVVNNLNSVSLNSHDSSSKVKEMIDLPVNVVQEGKDEQESGRGSGGSSAEDSSALVSGQEVVVVNPVLSDEQLVESIKAHGQGQAELEQLLTDREEKIAKVHEGIMAAGVDQPNQNDDAGTNPYSNNNNPTNPTGSDTISTSGSVPEVIDQHEFVVRAGGPSQ